VRLNITDPAGMWDVVLSCVSDAEVQDREGNSGRGFTNLKILLAYWGRVLGGLLCAGRCEGS
jgi:hypothetical protein